MVVRRLGVMSLARIMGAIYAAIGLVAGAFVALLSLFGAAIGAADQSGEAVFGALFGVGAIVFLPILYGFMGFCAGIIGAGLYNLFAGMVGGLVLEVAEG